MKLIRVPYGREDTPKELREYKINGVGPVGTIEEFKKFYPKETLEIVDFIYSDGGREKAGYKGKTGDCVTRAICNATGMDYQTVYDLLNSKRGKVRKKYTARTGVPRKVIKEVLSELGWNWFPIMQIGKGVTMHVRQDELPSGTLILSLSRHITCSKDGVIYDTFDCSRNGSRAVYGYWEKKNE